LTDAQADVGKRVARALLQAGCVSVQTDEPFRLPSGWASPVYMDCRRLISFPAIRRDLVAQSLTMLRSRGCLEDVSAIAGGEASGIALAAWLAWALELPLLYVRKKPAGRSQIEGVVAHGARVLLVDDLMAAGHSKLRFADALRAAGAEVENVFTIFDYGTFDSQALLATRGLRAHSLSNWADVLSVARETELIGAPHVVELQRFLQDPSGWSQAHGGISATQTNI
jgi:orotate phosphoribosyltransferase